eukprot:4466970-Amphidinium_carterae.1
MAHIPAGNLAGGAALADATCDACASGKVGGLGFGTVPLEMVPEEALAPGPVQPGRAALGAGGG